MTGGKGQEQVHLRVSSESLLIILHGAILDGFPVGWDSTGWPLGIGETTCNLAAGMDGGDGDGRPVGWIETC